jgi:NAD(P)-dependent dehydrogenase (short-subunit alcohol dehydrogenase family)
MNLVQLTAMYDFTGKTFVVTGGTGVLGGEVVCALAGCGAHVVVLDRHLSPTAGVVDYPTKRGCRVHGVQGNVLDRESLMRAAEAVQERFGPLYGLVNAAGGNRPTAITSAELSFFDIPEEALRFVLDLNLLGTILPCQVFGRQMAEAGEGVILNFSSMAAYRPLTNVVAYAAAKAGITNFTAWLAVHMAKHYSGKIRVNAIAPGFFLGEQNRDLLVDRETGQLTPRGQLVIDHTPMGRFGEPEDLLGTALWLLSPASAFVTGITVPVDGGFSAYAGV